MRWSITISLAPDPQGGYVDTHNQEGPGMNETTAAKKVGRPAGAEPKRGIGGKGRLLSANISQEIRDALEREAGRTGRSISQTAELWLEDARRGRAAVETIVGGYELVTPVTQLGEIARRVAELDLPPLPRRAALIAAWQEAIRWILPAVANPQTEEYLDAQTRFCESVFNVLSVLNDTASSDPVALRAKEGTPTPSGLLGNLIPSGPTLAEILRDAAQNGSWWTASGPLDELASAGATASSEIAEAKAAIAKVAALNKEIVDTASSAKAAGQAIARQYVGPPMLTVPQS
jgi:hypothetical protein